MEVFIFEKGSHGTKMGTVIAEYQESGLTVKEFCQLHSHSATYFRKMLKLYSESSDNSAAASSPVFLPASCVSSAANSIKIRINGNLVEFEEDIPSQVLNVLVKACLS